MKPPKIKKLSNIYEAISFSTELKKCYERFCICPTHKFDEGLYLKALNPGEQRDLKYDAWLHWLITEECFLSCECCTAGSQRQFNKKSISPINIPKLMSSLEKSGQVFRISFTGGGEPMVVPNILEACSKITEKHYISFNTNLIGCDMKDFLHSIDTSKLLQIHASLHLKELERTKTIDKFMKNFHACKNAGIPIYASAVGYPAIIPEIEKFRRIFHEQEIDFSFGPFSGEYNGQLYPHAYTAIELEQLGISPTIAKIHFIDDTKE